MPQKNFPLAYRGYARNNQCKLSKIQQLTIKQVSTAKANLQLKAFLRHLRHTPFAHLRHYSRLKTVRRRWSLVNRRWNVIRNSNAACNEILFCVACAEYLACALIAAMHSAMFWMQCCHRSEL